MLFRSNDTATTEIYTVSGHSFPTRRSSDLALYRGLPYDLPLGIELYSEVYAAPVQVSAIPAGRRESATDHTLRSHDDAVDLLGDLELAAEPPIRKPKAASGKQKAGKGGARQRRSAQNGGSGAGGGP